MDRNLFRRKAIDWDEWQGNGPAQAAQFAVPQGGQTPMAPMAAAHAQPVQPMQPPAARPMAPARPLARSPQQPQPVVQSAPVQQFATQPRSAMQPNPDGVPRSWREALSAGAHMPPVNRQPMPQSGPAAVQPPSPVPVQPPAVQQSAPAPQYRQAPVPHSVEQAQRLAAPVAAPVPSPAAQPQPPAATPQQPRQWQVPQQTVTGQGQAASQTVSQQAIATDQRRQQAQMQTALANAQSGSVDDANATTSHRHESKAPKSVRGRIWRSVAWVGAMASAFVISFAATVAPAYVHGRFNQPADAKTAAQTTAQQTAAAVDTAASGAGGLSVTNNGNTIQGTATQTGGGNLPQGYKQIKTMYKSVALAAQRQSLPTSYNGDPGYVKVAADNLKLQTTGVPTTRWGTAYIAEADGVQLALLANKQYLVVIQAQGHLNNDEWKDFLETFDAA